jgi:hypothetical protein
MSDIQLNLFKDLERAILLKHDEGSLKQMISKSRKSFNLLYTLSNKTFVADDFHEKCDGKGPTLTLLHGKYNIFFGGYTSQDWSCNSHRTKRDESAFLFFKNKNAEAECKIFRVSKSNADNAIVCDKKFGPTFGFTKTLTSRMYDLQTCFESGNAMFQEDKKEYFILNGQLKTPLVYQPSRADAERTEDVNGGTLSVSAMEVYQVIGE